MTNHVLIVDDYAPWLKYVDSLLSEANGWQVCGQASDGRQALEQAITVRPDLTVLDIELPSMNGIEVAKALLARSPRSKILFVSTHRSWDIVDAALATGAQGYVVKTQAAEELLLAMETIARGGRFISAALTGRRGDRTPHTPGQQKSRWHVAGFYPDGVLLDEYARFIDEALGAGGAVVYVAIPSRRDRVYRRLEAHGLDVDMAIKKERLLPLDVDEMLAAVMADGWPDEARFWRSGHLLFSRARRASAGQHSRVAACGDGAASLVQDGRLEAAIRLEQLWDDFATVYNVDIFCGYPASIAHDDVTDVFDRICTLHSACTTAESRL